MLDFLEYIIPDSMKKFLLLVLIVANGAGFVVPIVWNMMVLESSANIMWDRVITFYVVITMIDFFYIVFYGLFRRT
jgi:hypothetical protein